MFGDGRIHLATDAIHTVHPLEVDIPRGRLVAVTGVDLDIMQGEIFGLVGPNGSGKTTLTNAITGFYPPNAGAIRLGDRDITAADPDARLADLGIETLRTFSPAIGDDALEALTLEGSVAARDHVGGTHARRCHDEARADEERLATIAAHLADQVEADRTTRFGPVHQRRSEVELVVDVLFSDDDTDHLIWKWKPVDGTDPEPTTTGGGAN